MILFDCEIFHESQKGMDINMGATEIILIVIGVVIFLLGYLMPARKKEIDEEVQLISEDEVRKLISGEVEHVKDRIADIVDETVSYSIEKTERAMERLTNEKIMAINEYSDTVLEEINKNHKEVIFLYDMLNDKHDNLMATINEATSASEGVRQTLKDAEATVHEATDKADDVLRAVDEASARINDVLRAADDAVKGVWDAQNAARVAREAAQEAIRIASELTEGTKKETEVQVNRKSPVKAQQSQKPAASGSTRERAVSSAADNNPVPAAKTAKTPPTQTVRQEFPAEQEEIRSTALHPEGEDAGVEALDRQEFKPIAPKHVEIIHEPDKEEIYSEADTTAPVVDIQFAKDNGRNSNERILELHKAGKSNMAIAKELGLGLGEVKLVIDLFEGM